MPMQGGSLYHFYDGLWYDPTGSRTHDLPCERRTRFRLSQPDTVATCEISRVLGLLLPGFSLYDTTLTVVEHLFCVWKVEELTQDCQVRPKTLKQVIVASSMTQQNSTTGQPCLYSVTDKVVVPVNRARKSRKTLQNKVRIYVVMVQLNLC